MRSAFAVLIAGVGLILAAAPMTAHHSFGAEYNRSKPVSVTGKVVGVDWVNPHCIVKVMVTNSDGSSTVWGGEGKPPHVLIQNGWDRSLAESMVKSGEIVTIRGYAAKNGTSKMIATDLTRADGMTVLKWSGDPKEMASK